MILLVAKKLPVSIRGKLKLWFTEVSPNVFISGVKGSIATSICDEIERVSDASILIIKSSNGIKGYELKMIGEEFGAVIPAYTGLFP